MKKYGDNRRKLVSWFLLGLGTVFLSLGLLQGGYQDTLRKAVQVCLERIGIG